MEVSIRNYWIDGGAMALPGGSLTIALLVNAGNFRHPLLAIAVF
ncbi:hypothetical protein [Nodosilinea sp. FACHB-131]|nr:hypothetical protein [Nodosilinea sp. FACHB-131]